MDHILAVTVGAVIGFLLSVPVGPVGLIVFQRSMFKSRLLGLTTGVGAALGDAFLASIGAFGIRMIFQFIREHSVELQVLGGIFIIVFGLFLVFSRETFELKKKDSAFSLIEHFFSGIGLTITNPITAFTFFFIFARLGTEFGIGLGNAAPSLVVGVVLGSMTWWILLTYIAKIVGYRVKQEHLGIINKFFGFALSVIGAAMILGAFWK